MRNPGITAEQNWQACLDHMSSNSEYGSFLLDDDLYALDKIRQMIEYYLEDETIALVTSYRQPIDLEGNYLPDTADTQRICEQTTRFDGREVGRFALKRMTNFIGEQTTVFLRRDDLLRTLHNVYLGYETISPIGDLINSLSILLSGDMVYITEPLSYFRVHDGQSQKDITIQIWGLESWWEIIKHSHEHGVFFYDERDFLETAGLWLKLATNFFNGLYLNKQEDQFAGRPFKQYMKEAMKILCK